MGRTEYIPWSLERLRTHTMLLEEHAINGILFNDAYLAQEMEVLRRFIKPTDVCLHYSHRAVRGSLLRLCKKVITVMWDRRAQTCGRWRRVSCRLMDARFEEEPRMEIIYALASEESGVAIQRASRFSSYIKAAEMRKLRFDVVINDGHVKPQVAYAISCCARALFLDGT